MSYCLKNINRDCVLVLFLSVGPDKRKWAEIFSFAELLEIVSGPGLIHAVFVSYIVQSLLISDLAKAALLFLFDT